MRESALSTDRSTPRFDRIPAELKARRQWVVWRYVGKKRRKVPYTPGLGRPADPTDSDTWRSYAEAVAFYQSRSGYLDGIGYVFAADDPYVGGDQDNDLSLERIPATYAEISPSGTGIKFIARATGDYGRKTARGELYSSKRFFTITGNVLLGHEQITDCQAQVEAFAASLGGTTGKSHSRKTGTANGSRAELVNAIPEETWEAARQLLRDQAAIERLCRRVKAAAGEGTQFAVLLAEQYAEFHRRWSFVGLYRADGTLDDSMVRAVAARGIRGRGFTFVEYAAVMSRLYGAAMVAKWGAKESRRQELAALWEKSPAPRYERKATPAPAKRQPKVKRGRAGDHQALVEQVYSALQDHRAGAQAVVKTGEIAGVIGCHRRTIIRILDELEAAGRIGERKQLGRHSGLVIPILGVIYSSPAEAVAPQREAPNDAPIVAAPEGTEITTCVSSESREVDHSSPTLPELAAHYLDHRPSEIGQRCVSTRTGQVTYRRTAKHFAGLVVAEYPYTFDQALDAYAAEQQRRKDLAREEWRRFFTRLRDMTDDELISYIGGRCRTEVRELACDGSTFDKHLYSVRLRCARQQLRWRGLTMPSRKTRTAQAAQDDAQRAQAARQRLERPKAPIVACQPVCYATPAPVVEVGEAMRQSLLANLARLKNERVATVAT